MKRAALTALVIALVCGSLLILRSAPAPTEKRLVPSQEQAAITKKRRAAAQFDSTTSSPSQASAVSSQATGLGGHGKATDPKLGNNRDAFLDELHELIAWRKARRGENRDETLALEQVRRLTKSLRDDPALAFDFLDALRRTDDAKIAIALARQLRIVKTPELVARLRQLSAVGERAEDRRIALLALATRDFEQWFDRSRDALHRDRDASVREEAAHILGRAQADPKFEDRRVFIIDAIDRGFTAPVPTERVRALTVALLDRNPDRGRIARVRGCLKDEDGRVVTAARRALRVWGLAPE